MFILNTFLMVLVATLSISSFNSYDANNTRIIKNEIEMRNEED